MAIQKRTSTYENRSPKRFKRQSKYAGRDDTKYLNNQLMTPNNNEFNTPRKALINSTNTPTSLKASTSKRRRESISATETRRRSQRIIKAQYCVYTGRRIQIEKSSRSVSDKASQMTPTLTMSAGIRDLEQMMNISYNDERDAAHRLVVVEDLPSKDLNKESFTAENIKIPHENKKDDCGEGLENKLSSNTCRIEKSSTTSNDLTVDKNMNETLRVDNDHSKQACIHPFLHFIGGILIKMTGSIFDCANKFMPLNKTFAEIDNVLKSVSSRM